MFGARRAGRVQASLGVVTLLLIAACHSEPAPSPPPPTAQQPANWPQNLNDLRFRWSADAGLPLDTGWAVPLRAYLESLRIISYTRNLDAGYPGLTRATPEPVETFSPQWQMLALPQRDIRGTVGRVDLDNPDRRFVGNENFRVLRAEPITSGFRAFVCDDTFAVFKGSGGSRLAPLYVDSTKDGADPDLYNMSVWRVEFSDEDPRVGADPPAAPTSPQRGPLPAPRDDVFGPWFVTGSAEVSAWLGDDFPGLQSGTPEYDQRVQDAQAAEATLRQQCLDRYPLNSQQRKAIATTTLNSSACSETRRPWLARRVGLSPTTKRGITMGNEFSLDSAGLTPLADLHSQVATGLSQLAGAGAPQTDAVAQSFGNIAFAVNTALDGVTQSRASTISTTKSSSDTIAELLNKAHQMYAAR